MARILLELLLENCLLSSDTSFEHNAGEVYMVLACGYEETCKYVDPPLKNTTIHLHYKPYHFHHNS
jgi:hypothetical protein